VNVEVSTLNVLLAGVIGLQCWIIRSHMSLDKRLTRIETALGLDTKIFRKTPSKD
jgi:hypothetical protein